MPRSEGTWMLLSSMLCQRTASVLKPFSFPTPRVGSCYKAWSHSEASKFGDGSDGPHFKWKWGCKLPSFLPERMSLVFWSRGLHCPFKVIWASLDYFHFSDCTWQKRWANSTDLSSFLIFFMFSWYFLPCLGFIHSCRQVKIHRVYHHQRLEGWSSDKNPFRNWNFQKQWGRHTIQEKRNPVPSIIKLCSKTPCPSMPRRIYTHEIEKDASERRDQALL